ncbi:hypothetical protein D9611_013751 [Ephemerocybe angulata]|uniref:Uncharacterized protein n=1 Tax=Ephemerocybe angulata TaxID=980116 RepID=A0A8H5F1X9_9AGAR|nr:hypothetical protein D9611_013751 [Tulosesus angulatus]
MAILTLAPLLVRDTFSLMLGEIEGRYSVLCAILSVIGIPLLRETYAPVIRWKRAIKEGNVEVAERLNPSVLAAHGGTKSQVIWTNLSRPVVLLTRSYVCFLLSLYQALDTYGFGSGIGGLMYFGLGFGFMAATFACAKFSDRLYMKLSAKNGGKGTPEMRMPVLMIASVICPIGLLYALLLIYVE